MATVQRQAPKPAARLPNPPPKRNGQPVAARPSGHSQAPDPLPELGPDDAIRAFLYGMEGVGKTSFVAHAPKPGFLHDPQERGIHTLIKFKQCPKPVFTNQVDSFPDLLTQCRIIAKGRYDIQNLAIDSSTGIQNLCFAHHCKEAFNNNWGKEGFLAFQQGPVDAANTVWPEFLGALDEIAQAGINVWFLGHAQVKTFSNPDGPDYDRYIPYMQKDIWQLTKKWAQAVLFYTYRTEVEGKGLKKKATGEARQINTLRAPAYDAKNWWGMESFIDVGDSGKEAWEAFDAIYKNCPKRTD